MRRFLYSVLVVLGIISFSFFLIHWVPGDPVDLMLGDQTSSIEQEELRTQMGLHSPIYQQYFTFLFKLFQFDLGVSIYNQKPSWELIAGALLPTLCLALSALFLATLLGIPLAFLSAIYKNSIFDRMVSAFSVCGFSLPVFFIAPLFIWGLSIYWPLFPVSGHQGWRHYVLPSISLALPLGAALCQMGRASVLEIFQKDYVRTARAKGIHPFYVYSKHIFKPVLIPLITIFSLQLAALLTGVIIVETIFDWPGMGLLLFRSITRRDYPVVQACVLVISLIYLLVNFLADTAYQWVHPQMRVK